MQGTQRQCQHVIHLRIREEKLEAACGGCQRPDRDFVERGPGAVCHNSPHPPLCHWIQPLIFNQVRGVHKSRLEILACVSWSLRDTGTGDWLSPEKPTGERPAGEACLAAEWRKRAQWAGAALSLMGGPRNGGSPWATEWHEGCHPGEPPGRWGDLVEVHCSQGFLVDGSAQGAGATPDDNCISPTSLGHLSLILPQRAASGYKKKRLTKELKCTYA